jgi:glucans biosynthesis protein
MHGGGRRCGAPRGNGNAQKHGLFTRRAMVEREEVRLLLGDAQKLLRELE